MKQLHVFRCGVEDLYAITEDATGANLPAELCGSRWLLMKTTQFDGHLPPWGLDVVSEGKEGALLAGLSQNGYFISEGNALPAEIITPDPT